MNNSIKKDLTSNWFKLLQNAFCNDIHELENNKNVYLKMYALNDKLEYTELLKKYKEIYLNLSKMYLDIPNDVNSKSVMADDTPTNTTSLPTVDQSLPKRRVPSESPSNYDIGYVKVSDNDSREYIVKQVAGKAGQMNKRWILNK